MVLQLSKFCDKGRLRVVRGEVTKPEVRLSTSSPIVPR